MSQNAAWRKYVKPWRTPTAWEKQNPCPWEPISAQEIIDATDELHRAEKLLILEEPDLNVTNRGRPAEGKNMTKEARTNYLTNHITNYLTNYLTIRPN